MEVIREEVENIGNTCFDHTILPGLEIEHFFHEAKMSYRYHCFGCKRNKCDQEWFKKPSS